MLERGRTRWKSARAAVAIVCVLALTGLGATAGGAADTRTERAQLVRVTFTGKGGGRYLDITRWLRDDTRECYARRTADETIAVSWRLVWSARLSPSGRGLTLVSVAPEKATATGRARGTSVRDSCDAAEDEEPGWAGSDRCDSALPVGKKGGLTARTRTNGVALALRGPFYRGPSLQQHCELDIRNDQLAAHFFLDAATLARLADGRSVNVPVGTKHPRPGDAFEATRNCSAFPHIYDGVVYLYDCDDTLVWSGRLSVVPA
jgi:hypothetical protein